LGALLLLLLADQTLRLLLLLLPLYECTPLLGTPDGIKLEVRPVAFAIEELLALDMEVLQVLNRKALVLILLPQIHHLLLDVFAPVPLAAFFIHFFRLGREMVHSLISLLNLCLLLRQLACESLFFRETRNGFHFEISCTREQRKSCEEAILIVDHNAVPIAQPLFDLRFVRLAEDFVIGLQGCNSKNNPVSVRRMINIHTQVLVAPLCQGTQHSFQNSL
jgi:hypothetical protein